jgi:exopolysaccharide biosynthesis polyprenyl glycosylphosphotransferase
MYVLDILIVAVAYIAAIHTYRLFRGVADVDVVAHYGLLPIVLILFAVSRNLFGSDLEIRSQTISEQMGRIVKEMSLTLGLVITLIFLLKLTLFSRLVLISFGIASVLALVLARQLVVWFYFSRKSNSTENHLRVLIVGSGRRARMLGDQLQESSAWGVRIVGYLDPTGKSAGRRSSDVILGDVEHINTVLRDNVVEDVIVAVPRSMLGDVQAIIDACQEEGVRLRFMADIYDIEAARIQLTQVNNIPLLGFEPVARSEGALLAKRIFDLTVTLAAMPVLLPFLALVAIAIRIDSKGPVFFMQNRIGLHKRPFRMYKFRSMVPDAEARMSEVEHLNEADGPNFKIEDDPRVTRLGRFIRKTSIDELPQLFNVVLGDMSLVGPRPMSKRDVELFDKGVQRKRFSVRPGITCLWQISGRSDLNFDEWLELDLQYIESWTFWLDIKILLMTVPTVLKGSGAV